MLGRGVDFTDGPDGNVIFANDTSLPTEQGFQGSGQFPDLLLGVRIPTLHRYIEALILLALGSEPSSISRSAWLSELTYVVNLGKLDRLGHPAFRRFCVGFRDGGTDLRILISETQKALGPRLGKAHPMLGCKHDLGQSHLSR